eukprot:m.226050 g.226050  ORF g.226050 m.226050 type:complete len:325 (+) comp16865_c0_seq1:423-1397(+)
MVGHDSDGGAAGAEDGQDAAGELGVVLQRIVCLEAGIGEAGLGRDVDGKVVGPNHGIDRVAAGLKEMAIQFGLGEERADARHNRRLLKVGHRVRLVKGHHSSRVQLRHENLECLVGLLWHRDKVVVIVQRVEVARVVVVDATQRKGLAIKVAVKVLDLVAERLVGVMLLLGAAQVVAREEHLLNVGQPDTLGVFEQLGQGMKKRRLPASLQNEAVGRHKHAALTEDIRVHVLIVVAAENSAVDILEQFLPQGASNKAETVAFIFALAKIHGGNSQRARGRCSSGVEPHLEILLGSFEKIVGRGKGFHVLLGCSECYLTLGRQGF